MRAVARSIPVLAVVIAAVVAAGVRGDFKDLLVYQHAGRALLDGASVYGDRVGGLRFTYPPVAAILATPLAWPPAWLAAALWTAASVGALAVVLVIVLREQGRPAPGWLVALLVCGALAFEPVWQNLTFGQVNLLLMLAVLTDLLRPERRWSGLLVGLAAGVKLTPLVLVVMLALVGHPRAAARAALTFAATVAVGYVAMPRAATSYWTDDVVRAGRVGPPELAHNQSVYGALTRLLDDPPPVLLWLAVAGPLALAVLLVGAAWWRRGDRVLGGCLAALAMLLASPVSWSHHWVWAVPLALVLWERSRWAAVAWSAVFVARPILWPPWGEHREFAWSPFDHVVGNAYVLAALALAGWTGAVLARSRLAVSGGAPVSGDGSGGRAGDHHGLARAVVAAGQEGVQLVTAPRARQTVREVGVPGLDGVPHGRASFLPRTLLGVASLSMSPDRRRRYDSSGGGTVAEV
ncbi:MAG TPA: glycosyltransferase 87 family protein [Nocardioides sp.]|uniref:glycosyltransferase 87 family protein n=1 Tax=Nocardioides sp. TaxID=35761 RepID=UPI002E31F68F|nr:glycosyltransferase 87 family protein [Nocardioides sp.]HEX5087198.1 glycosyltransferase 87 family protein [Nocardioides sp.]